MQKKKKMKFSTKTMPSLIGDEQNGLIVAHFGAVAEVENESGDIIRCHLRKNFEPVMTGDRVLWRKQDDQSGLIVRLLERKSVLERPEGSKRTKLIAANIDAIIIVTAPPPVLSLRLLDRYIVAAEYLKIMPIILLNKADLLDEEALPAMRERLAHYEKMGYTVIFSVFQDNGLQQLSQVLQDKTAVLVGVSGVGKSSIIRELTGATDIMIGERSLHHLGKHTTTTARLYHATTGGHLIDSPGVREFVLWHLPEHQILQGFIDFLPFLGHCKFRNCRHRQEPGCALRQAVEEQKIHPERWLSFQDISGVE